MTGEAHSLASTRLDRPAGYFPRGTSLGLVGLIGLFVGVPFFGLECAAPFVVGGFDRWLASAPYVVGFGIVGSLATVFSMATHRYWSVCLFFYVSCASLLAYLLAMLFALGAVGGLFTVRDPGLGAMPVVGLSVLLGLGLGAWSLLRALRLRYWQPGTTPEMWELQDETPPSWSLSPRR